MCFTGGYDTIRLSDYSGKTICEGILSAPANGHCWARSGRMRRRECMGDAGSDLVYGIEVQGVASCFLMDCHS